MKKHLLIASLLVSGASMAQFTQSNEPAISDSKLMFVVDSFVTDYATTTGTGVTWDYSAIVGIPNETKTVDVVDPSTTAQASSFTTSTKALEIPGFITSYFTSSSSARNSQGFSFDEPTFGTVNAIFSGDDELLMNYPFAVSNSLSDVVSGNVSASLGTFPCTGVANATVDGSGTLLLNSTTSISNVLRYKIVDSLNANAGLLGTVTMKRIQYEYYDLANSTLPLFIHSNLVITVSGSPQTLNLVLSSVQPDNFLAVATAELTGVSIYPNPASEVITVKGLTTEGTVQLVDAQGKVVKTAAVAAGTQSLNISDINAGMYIMTVQTANGVATQRVVVE